MPNAGDLFLSMGSLDLCVSHPKGGAGLWWAWRRFIELKDLP